MKTVNPRLLLSFIGVPIGIFFRQPHGIPTFAGSGVAVADINSDLWPDIVVSSQGHTELDENDTPVTVPSTRLFWGTNEAHFRSGSYEEIETAQASSVTLTPQTPMVVE